MTFTKTQLALGITAAALSMAIVAPQAVAAESKADRVADATARKTEALEAQMQQMADQMQAMQAELSRVKSSSANASAANAKVQELDQWMASVKAAPAEASRTKDNLVAVRGGWSALDHARGSDLNFPANALSNGAFLSNNQNNEGYYFGGAFDFNVNNDLFGLMDGTSFGIELGIEYSQYGTGDNSLTQVTVVNLHDSINTNRSTDARLRINASPKIKFMHDSKLRPWIIPVGMDINILGVPSNAVSVLNAGMNFGAGVDYELFRGIVIGADTRYHYSTSKIDGTPTDGFNAGGYVGFKF
ncbi:MAG: porin family protein [Methylococcaceae bacterium]|nr:porin family protein [Methylococcaceae bacterium]